MKFVHLLLLLMLMLAVLFSRGLGPDHTVSSNDGPLGAVSATTIRPPSAFLGVWHDLNWIGNNSGVLPLGPSGMLAWLCGPLAFSKLYAPFALLFVGLSAWLCFRQMKFSPWACVLGGIAASLNSDFFGTACWGVAGHPICFGFGYLALAALSDTTSGDRWPRAILAGLAVGLGVMEGADIGALFSVVIADFVVVQSVACESRVVKKIGSGLGRLAVVTIFAGLIAAASMTALITTQIAGVVGMTQDADTKAQRWAEATQYSIPKAEALGILAPGLFGLRFDTPDGGAYWGTAGSDPAWDGYLASGRQGPPPGGPLRAGAGSNYAGWLVLLGAAWAVLQSLRGQKSFFSPPQRTLIWFWSLVALVSLLLLFGRFAPFYKFFYALPYASTIRNPAKFLHLFEWSLILLFGYGMHGLATLYLEKLASTPAGLADHLRALKTSASAFDRKWVMGSCIGLAAAIIAWGVYATFRGQVEAYLAELSRLLSLQAHTQHDPVAAAEAAHATVSFSLGQVGWAIVFFGLSAGLLALIVSGYFAGRRAAVAGVLLCATLAIDLGWQDRAWIRTWNWKEKYVEAGDNPVFDLLRQHPYEQRVSEMPRWLTSVFQLDPRLAAAQGMFQSVYGSEWTQHLFLFNNLQTLDIVQMPRRPVEYEAFEQALQFDYTTNTLHLAARRWQLTNTRYIVGAAPLVTLLNRALDPEQQRFHARMLFELYQSRDGGPILTRTNATGPFALIEFTGALPRAKLYTDWQRTPYDAARVNAWIGQKRATLPPFMTSALSLVNTNELATLERLADKSFEPQKTVLLAEPLAAAPPTNATPGTVRYLAYSPKHLLLRTSATSPAVLLLNDKHDPSWRVTVDGAPAALLRCNYLMRGVYLPSPGEHTVEFSFRRPQLPFYLSVGAMALGVLLLVFVSLHPFKRPTPQSA